MNPNMHAVWDACAELDSLDGPRRVSDTGRLAYLLKEANNLAAIGANLAPVNEVPAASANSGGPADTYMEVSTNG